MEYCDSVIIGAGAAGLMCASEAGKRGRKVLLLEKSKSVGEKIRISGGGRCNFTNLYCSHKNYISGNPKFSISALNRYTQHDFINLVKRYEIAYHEKTLGQLFCDKSSQQIIDMLLKECENSKVDIRLNSNVIKINKDGERFVVNLSDGGTLVCESLVIAAGGLSIPKMGATSFGYDVARQFGLKIVELRPALVPFTLVEEKLKNLKDLSGVSVDDVIVKCNGVEFREAMLFTHRGLSGPAILQISSYWKAGDEIEINLYPKAEMLSVLKDKRTNLPKREVQGVIAEFLPKRLAEYLTSHLKAYGKKMADLNNQQLIALSSVINNWRIVPNGTEGYRTAEVTAGGVDTGEISSKTFECNNIKGLYFIGEVLDVTGHLGGFNFQWAWSSGWAAGQFV